MVRTSYTGIPGGMLRHEYDVSTPRPEEIKLIVKAAFWVATKRDCQA